MLPHSGNHLNDLITSAVIGVLMALFFGKNKAGKSLDDSITSAIKRGFASLFGGRNKYPPEKNPDNPNMSANGAARFDNNSLYDELPKKNGLSNTTVFILYVIIIGGLAYVIISSYSDRQKETVVTLAPESQNQQDQGASQQRVEQIHEVVFPEEVARLEAQKQSERIKLMFNEKNYEALSSEYSTEKNSF